MPCQPANALPTNQLLPVPTPEVPAELERLSVWSAGLPTSFWRALTIDFINGTDTELTVDATLRTEQAARDGQTCSDGNLRYKMTWDGEI